MDLDTIIFQRHSLRIFFRSCYRQTLSVSLFPFHNNFYHSENQLLTTNNPLTSRILKKLFLPFSFPQLSPSNTFSRSPYRYLAITIRWRKSWHLTREIQGRGRRKSVRLKGLLKVFEQGEGWTMVITAHSARGGRVKQRLTRRQSRCRQCNPLITACFETRLNHEEARKVIFLNGTGGSRNRAA